LNEREGPLFALIALSGWFPRGTRGYKASPKGPRTRAKTGTPHPTIGSYCAWVPDSVLHNQRLFCFICNFDGAKTIPAIERLYPRDMKAY
jgi:hypothetical protein